MKRIGVACCCEGLFACEFSQPELLSCRIQRGVVEEGATTWSEHIVREKSKTSSRRSERVPGLR